jgi:hypothetical protein
MLFVTTLAQAFPTEHQIQQRNLLAGIVST